MNTPQSHQDQQPCTRIGSIAKPVDQSLVEHFKRIRPTYMEGDSNEQFKNEMDYWRDEVREAGYDPDKQFKRI